MACVSENTGGVSTLNLGKKNTVEANKNKVKFSEVCKLDLYPLFFVDESLPLGLCYCLYCVLCRKRPADLQ